MMRIVYGHEERVVNLETLQKEVGPGWASLLERLVNDLLSLGWNGYVLQVKSKFGTLRFYLPAGSAEALHNRVDQASLESANVCEECGKPSTKADLYDRSLCEHHRV